MRISNIAKQSAQVVTQIGGGAANMHGALMSFGEAVGKGDAGSILSTASGVISTVNSIATIAGNNSKGSDAMALGAAATSLTMNINKLSEQVERNEPIKLTDVQNVIGDVFSIAGDTASLVGGAAGQALGLELNTIGLGIKAYGEATLGNQTMSPGDLFNADNWKGFGWDLAERWSRKFYELFPDELNPWKEDINRDGKYHVLVYDPLALDLDGDGIETVGTQGYQGALFDHDKDGIRTSTASRSLHKSPKPQVGCMPRMHAFYEYSFKAV